MTGKRVEWIDHAWDRLRLLLPGEYMTAGELFAEVQGDIPLHLAMRHAIRLSRGKEVPVPTAQWALFSHRLRATGFVERISCGKATKNSWHAHDKVRLSLVKDKECPKCGHASLITVRGLHYRMRDVQREVCERCEHPQLSTEASKRLQKMKVDAEEAVAAWRLNGKAPEPPILPPTPPPAPVSVPASAVVTVRHFIPHRVLARMVRALLPDRNSVSLNQIDRELASARGNVATVLERHGYNASDQQALVNRNRLLTAIYNKMGIPV